MLLLTLLDHTRTWMAIVASLVFGYFGDVKVVYTVAGAIVTTIIAKTLKVIIRQPRPDSIPSPPTSPEKRREKVTYGMPSTHSSSIIFFATYITLQLFSSSLPQLAILFLSAAVIVTALSVVWSRVELGHHTRGQVIAGMVLGLLCGLGWDAWWWRWWKPWLVGMKLDGRFGWKELEIVSVLVAKTVFRVNYKDDNETSEGLLY